MKSFTLMTAALAALTLTAGCSAVSGSRCKSCQTNYVPQQYYGTPAPYSDDGYGTPGGAAPMLSPLPAPIPPAEVGPPVPPPPTGASRPSAVQRIGHSTTNFFRSANENVREMFHR
jgi:hypothetical protein